MSAMRAMRLAMRTGAAGGDNDTICAQAGLDAIADALAF